MTALWSDDDEKTQLAGEMDDHPKQITAYHGDIASRMDVQRDPYANHPRYESASSESSPNSDLKARFDDEPPIVYPQRSNNPPASRPPVHVLDIRDHSYIPPDPTVLHSPPPPRPEKSTARRSRAPVWEMVSTDQDEPQEYYVGSPGGAIVKRGPSARVATLSHKRSSNLHPIVQHYSSPISTCVFYDSPAAILIFVHRCIRRSAQFYHRGRSLG